jgi:hypothetical protein
MARVAAIRDFERLCRARRNEFESVAAHIYVSNLLLDFRHVAADALITSARYGMMRVGFNGRAAWAIRRIRPVTSETD